MKSLYFRHRRMPSPLTPTRLLFLLVYGLAGLQYTVTAASTQNLVHNIIEPITNSHVFLPVIFTNFPTAPGAPSLNPIPNEDQDNHYQVTWGEGKNATSYTLQESTAPDFVNAVVAYQGNATSWSTDSQGKIPGTYYYRVKGTNPQLESDWSNIQSVVIYPRYIGWQALWYGSGYIRGYENFDVGYHEHLIADLLTEVDTLRVAGRLWYDPNPQNWEEDNWFSYYSVTNGEWKASSEPKDPEWKWGSWMMLPFAITLKEGQPISVNGQPFSVSGPHPGYTSWGQGIQYWELRNKERLLYWESGELQQYVHEGEAVLRYDAGSTRLILHEDVKRRLYYQGEEIPGETVQYITILKSASSFPGSPTPLLEVTLPGVAPQPFVKPDGRTPSH